MKPPPSSRWTRECHRPRDFLGILKISNLTSLSHRLLSLLYMPTSWFPMVALCLFSLTQWKFRNMRMKISIQIFQNLPIQKTTPIKPILLTVRRWESVGNYRKKYCRSILVFSSRCTKESEAIEHQAPNQNMLVEDPNLWRIGNIHTTRRRE